MIKPTTIILALLVVAFATFTLACARKPGTNQSASTTPTAGFSPSSENSSASKSRSGNLVEATSNGDIGYELAGAGDSTSMNLKVRNKTERVWEVKIEVGTKLEPAENDVQQMVVTKEVEVHLEPHDEKSLELEVSCLDISKEAPADTNTKWRIEGSNNLSQFIRCANDVANEFIARGELDEENRSGLIQFALWQARGATRDQWVRFYEEYQDYSREKAEQSIDEAEPMLKKVTNRCPGL